MNSKARLANWLNVCAVPDIGYGKGVIVSVEGAQVALFHTSEGFFALGNEDPISGANVLAWGRLDYIRGKLVVVSPANRQHFCLYTGICLEDMRISVPVWPVTVRDSQVFVATQPSAG